MHLFSHNEANGNSGYQATTYKESIRLDRQAGDLAKYTLEKARQGQVDEPIPAKTHRLNPLPRDLPEAVFEIAGRIMEGWGYEMDHERAYRNIVPGLPLLKLPRHTVTVRPLEFTE